MAKEDINPANGTAAPEQGQQNNPETAQQAPAAEPAKRDRRKKDPNEPTLVPFQLITAANRERLALIGKADNDTLTALLDAYESKPGNADNTQLLQANTELKKELAELQRKLTVALEEKSSYVTAASSHSEQQKQEITALKQQLSSTDELIAASEQQVTALQKQISDMEQESSNADQSAKIQELQTKLQEMTARATKAEDEVKDNRKLIKGLNDAKHELEKQVNELNQRLDEARDAYLNTERAEVAQPQHNLYPEGDILHYFPTITAKMLEETASRLTAKRKDGLTVTPQMILGDMFNKYTIQRLTNWFYWPVMDDKDITDIAQDVDPRLTTIRMVKAALGID